MPKEVPWLRKPKLDPALKRDKVMNIHMTESEYNDLILLSEMHALKPYKLLYSMLQSKLSDNAEAIQAYRKLKSTLK